MIDSRLKQYYLGCVERLVKIMRRSPGCPEDYHFAKFSNPGDLEDGSLDIQLRSNTSQFVLQMHGAEKIVFGAPPRDDPDPMLRVDALKVIGADPLFYQEEERDGWSLHHIPESVREDAKKMLEDYWYDVKHDWVED